VNHFKVSNQETEVVGPRSAGQFIVGRDPGMSGWGGAEDGRSYAVWACKDIEADSVLAWAIARGDLVGVRIQHGTLATRPGDHVHIYEVGDCHPSLD